jgi:cytochrome bd ubiquinol oxidase subunit I
MFRLFSCRYQGGCSTEPGKGCNASKPMDALTADGLQFVFHYLFPQLTMGLALLILILKTIALRTANEEYNQAAHFWTRIFAINFAMGVVTGVPMEFQFGTNWAAFSRSAGSVIGQTLAMEGVFAFFLESSFLGLFLFGEKRLGPRLHWATALLVFLGSWSSGYFIIATDAWMQHPVGYRVTSTGAIELESFWSLLSNPWLAWQYPHNMSAAVITGSIVMSANGAFYLLTGQHHAHARIFMRTGVIAGAIASCLMMYPLGDGQARNVAAYQPLTLAAMEGLFHTEKGAPLAILGQPNMETQKLDNPLVIPDVLSFLTYRRFNAEIKGLDAYRAAPLLRLPQHGWTGDVLHRDSGVCAVRAMARISVPDAAVALGPDVAGAVSLHRNHVRLDDCRTWPSALVDLRSDAHR